LNAPRVLRKDAVRRHGEVADRGLAGDHPDRLRQVAPDGSPRQADTVTPRSAKTSTEAHLLEIRMSFRGSQT
jgi:hypothetical protein